MLNLTHGVWHLYSLRRLANVEMFSVTSCVERRRCRCSLTFANTLVTAGSNIFSPVATPLLGTWLRSVSSHSSFYQRFFSSPSWDTIWWDDRTNHHPPGGWQVWNCLRTDRSRQPQAEREVWEGPCEGQPVPCEGLPRWWCKQSESERRWHWETSRGSTGWYHLWYQWSRQRYEDLYNNVTSVCIFIGCWPWSIKGELNPKIKFVLFERTLKTTE